MPKKRIFVAIKISDEIVEKVVAFQKGFEKLPLRLILPQNLHITLIPPWYEQDLDTVVSRLRKVRQGVFEIAFTKLTIGPRRDPRLIWARGETQPLLTQLTINIEKSLKRLPSGGPILMHMTIARFRKEQMSAEIKNLNEPIYWTQKVDSFVLMESHLSPKGASYTVIEKFTF